MSDAERRAGPPRSTSRRRTVTLMCAAATEDEHHQFADLPSPSPTARPAWRRSVRGRHRCQGRSRRATTSPGAWPSCCRPVQGLGKSVFQFPGLPDPTRPADILVATKNSTVLLPCPSPRFGSVTTTAGRREPFRSGRASSCPTRHRPAPFGVAGGLGDHDVDRVSGRCSRTTRCAARSRVVHSPHSVGASGPTWVNRSQSARAPAGRDTYRWTSRTVPPELELPPEWRSAVGGVECSADLRELIGAEGRHDRVGHARRRELLDALVELRSGGAPAPAIISIASGSRPCSRRSAAPARPARDLGIEALPGKNPSPSRPARRAAAFGVAADDDRHRAVRRARQADAVSKSANVSCERRLAAVPQGAHGLDVVVGRRPRSANGTPSASNSSFSQPTPTPSSIRPPRQDVERGDLLGGDQRVALRHDQDAGASLIRSVPPAT